MREDYTRGSASAGAFRWHEFGKPGTYLVCVFAGWWPNDFGTSFDAVVDDFGNLVRVP